MASKNEIKKNKREVFLIIALLFSVLLLAWGEVELLRISKDLPFEHSVFFIGLVNFNIILFLFLLFLIFRNVVKAFSRRPSGPVGSSLRSKMTFAFVAFSVIPTLLMFLVSVFYINNSFDKWFNQRMEGVLRSSLEVTNNYYKMAKKRNYHFASLIKKDIEKLKTKKEILNKIKQLQERYKLDYIQFYYSLTKPPLRASTSEQSLSYVPRVSLEFLKKGYVDELETSVIHNFKKGNLIHVITPLDSAISKRSALVVSTYTPVSLLRKIDEISSTYQNLNQGNKITSPIKSIYIIILVLITLVILLAATWVGLYLAQQLSVPLELLGKAAQKISKGYYVRLRIKSGAPEINQLVDDFNAMTQELSSSQAKIQEAERASAWQEVAKRIAHEIKNPLTPISLSAQRLERKFSSQIKDAAFLECTSMIINQVDSLKDLVNEFSQFARMPKVMLLKSSVYDEVNEIIDMYKQVHNEVKFVNSLQECPEVMLDKAQFKRALANLVDNAVSAVKGVPRATIEFSLNSNKAKNRIELMISDNGAGIPNQLKSSIFEPYVTTKSHGTGLGLAIVKKTIEDHGGEIQLELNKKNGTSFLIYLPFAGSSSRKVT